MRVRILADDLSGAADCAASFSGACGPMPLLLKGPGSSRSYALDTDSRAMDETSAAAVWGGLAREIDGEGIFFKKIDSTLRGHIVAETEALLAARRDIERAIFTPAFPAQGRALARGRLVVHGVARGEAPQFGDSRVAICDAETEADLARIVLTGRRAAGMTLWIGSSGLARVLAGAEPRRVAAASLPGPKLIVVGSFSDVARAQVAAFRERFPESGLAAGEAARAAHVMQAHGIALVHIPEAPRTLGRALVAELARSLREAALKAGTLVLTGGDTARAMLEVLGIDAPLVEGELEPGVAVCSTAGPRVVIKAGGFGDNGLFLRMR